MTAWRVALWSRWRPRAWVFKLLRPPYVLALPAAAIFHIPPLAAQDFAPAAGAGPGGGACVLLERALPEAAPGVRAEALQASWTMVPELATRAVAAGGSWHSARFAAGLSQTGAPEWGWTGVALAVGAAERGFGGAIRVLARRDRAPEDATSGLEIGAGSWGSPAPGVRVWAQAPQCATRGAAPPLARPLEMGVSGTLAAARAWLALEAPGRGGDGERALGVALRRGDCELWGEARDGPWRAALGIAARVRAITCALRIDAHPALGTRTTLVLGAAAPNARGSGPP